MKQTRIDQCLRDLTELQEQVDRFRDEINVRNQEIQRIRHESQKDQK